MKTLSRVREYVWWLKVRVGVGVSVFQMQYIFKTLWPVLRCVSGVFLFIMSVNVSDDCSCGKDSV